MAGDWIKFEHVTPDKPEVVQMAGKLEIDQDCVVGKLLRLWIWSDQQSVSGDALIVTEAFLDRLVFCAGFSKALRSVGWLEGRDGRLSLPNFIRHNGETAKKRALSKDRNAAKRKRDAESVTKASPEKRREEKRREENKDIPPMPSDIQKYIDERRSLNPGLRREFTGQQFFDHYSSQGWVGGNGIPVTDWKAKIRVWERKPPDKQSEKPTDDFYGPLKGTEDVE